LPPSVYLDQSALIDLHQQLQNDATWKTRLFGAIKRKTFIVVLSPWHWVETARTRDIEKAGQLGEFMDALEPLWLRDRRDLERIEVQDGFFSFARIPHVRPPYLITRTELLSAMNGTQLSPVTTPSSRKFVETWITKPELMGPLTRSHQGNVEALKSLRDAIASGKLTAAMKAEGDRSLLEGFLPKMTPAGVMIDAGTKHAYLETVSPKNFPTLAIESEVAEYSWKNPGRTDWNSMVDKFHLISAVPYVDVIVSDDRYFRLLLPVAQETGFVKARIVKFQEFCKTFLQEGS
jgi:hypothetical protein